MAKLTKELEHLDEGKYLGCNLLSQGL